MSLVWRKLRRSNQEACKYRFTATFQELMIQCGGRWHPDKVSICWLRKRSGRSSRQIETKAHKWEPTLTDPCRGLVVWPSVAPESLEIITTLYRDRRTDAYDDKEWTFVVKEVLTSGKLRPLASVPLNLRLFRNEMPGSSTEIKLKLRSCYKHVVSVAMQLELTCMLVCEGDALDDDMQSISSMMSLKNTGMVKDGDRESMNDILESRHDIATCDTSSGAVSDDIAVKIADLAKEIDSFPSDDDSVSTPVSSAIQNGPDLSSRHNNTEPWAPHKPNIGSSLSSSRSDAYAFRNTIDTHSDSRQPALSPPFPASGSTAESISLRQPESPSQPLNPWQTKYKTSTPKAVPYAKRSASPQRDKDGDDVRTIVDPTKTPQTDSGISLEPPPDNSTLTSQDLLAWCQEVTKGYRGVKITNFGKCWRNGLAFCAIIDHFSPDLIPFDELNDSVTPQNIEKNCKLAFDAAAKLGVQKLIKIEDMKIMAVPDKIDIITYLHLLRSHFTGQKTQNVDNLWNPRHSLISLTEIDNRVAEEFEKLRAAKERESIMYIKAADSLTNISDKTAGASVDGGGSGTGYSSSIASPVSNTVRTYSTIEDQKRHSAIVNRRPSPYSSPMMSRASIGPLVDGTAKEDTNQRHTDIDVSTTGANFNSSAHGVCRRSSSSRTPPSDRQQSQRRSRKDSRRSGASGSDRSGSRSSSEREDHRLSIKLPIGKDGNPPVEKPFLMSRQELMNPFDDDDDDDDLGDSQPRAIIIDNRVEATIHTIPAATPPLQPQSTPSSNNPCIISSPDHLLASEVSSDNCQKHQTSCNDDRINDDDNLSEIAESNEPLERPKSLNQNANDIPAEVPNIVGAVIADSTGTDVKTRARALLDQFVKEHNEHGTVTATGMGVKTTCSPSGTGDPGEPTTSPSEVSVPSVNGAWEEAFEEEDEHKKQLRQRARKLIAEAKEQALGGRPIKISETVGANLSSRAAQEPSLANIARTGGRCDDFSVPFGGTLVSSQSSSLLGRFAQSAPTSRHQTPGSNPNISHVSSPAYHSVGFPAVPRLASTDIISPKVQFYQFQRKGPDGGPSKTVLGTMSPSSANDDEGGILSSFDRFKRFGSMKATELSEITYQLSKTIRSYSLPKELSSGTSIPSSLVGLSKSNVPHSISVTTGQKDPSYIKTMSSPVEREVESVYAIAAELEMISRKQSELDQKAQAVERKWRIVMQQDEGEANPEEEEKLMQEFLTLLNERNQLTRREYHLQLLQKIKERERRFNLVQHELAELISIDEREKTETVKEDIDKLMNELIILVNKRDELAQQLISNEAGTEEDEDTARDALANLSAGQANFQDKNCCIQ